MMSMYKPNMKLKPLGQGYRRAQISQSLHTFAGVRFFHASRHLPLTYLVTWTHRGAPNLCPSFHFLPIVWELLFFYTWMKRGHTCCAEGICQHVPVYKGDVSREAMLTQIPSEGRWKCCKDPASCVHAKWWHFKQQKPTDQPFHLVKTPNYLCAIQNAKESSVWRHTGHIGFSPDKRILRSFTAHRHQC